MPNIKASILSVRKDAKRHARNVAEKDAVKAAIRKVNAAVTAGNSDEAKAALSLAAKTIDKAASNNTIHENVAARKKSTLAKKVNAMA